ncbi:CHAT domain-containing tetratricopeptide repeat protein [Massilia sp. 9I]|uniref:CHAT domain-containing protein n=1 Tax=Massilia sp. 9I TaxID=2653152 RepID=UPI001356F459|nr:CHAT domain-containing tetratricopeptide repeat protein [Massilia sp. 9I]
MSGKGLRSRFVLRMVLFPLALLLPMVPGGASAQDDEKPSDAKLLAQFRVLCPAQGFAAPISQSEAGGRGAPAASASVLDGDEDFDFALSNSKLSQAQNLIAEGRWEMATSLLCDVLRTRYNRLGLLDLGTLAVLNNFGVFLRKSGRGADARFLLEEAIALANALTVTGSGPLGDRLTGPRFKMRLNLALSLYELRQYEAAAEILTALVKQAVDQPSVDAESRSIAAASLGQTLGALGRLVEAERYLRAALDIRLETAPYSQGVPATMTELGANLSAQGKYKAGEMLLRRARQLRVAMFQVDHLNTAFSNKHLASNLIAQGRYAEALPFAKQALATQRARLPSLHPDRVLSLTVLGNARLGLGDAKGALAAAREAASAQLSRSASETAQAKPDPLISPLRRYQDPQRLLLRSAWASLPGGRRTWESASVPEVVGESFLAAQRLIWSSAGDAIANAAARRVATQHGLGELAARLETLRDRVEQLDAAVGAAAASNLPAGAAALLSLREQREQTNQQLGELVGELRSRFPAFFAYLNPEPIPLATLQKLLKTGEVLIFITPGQNAEHGFVWAVTRERVAWVQIPLSGDTFVRMVRSLRLVIDPKGARSPDQDDRSVLAAGARGFDRKAAFRLYKHLFGDPAIAALVTKMPRWLVVTQGEAVALPLAALVAAEPHGGQSGDVDPATLRSTRWVAFEHELALLPTISSFASLRLTANVHASGRRPFFGLGDPSFQGSNASPQETGSYFSDGDVRLGELRKLAPLPGTRTEIESLARTLGGGPDDILLGPDASESRLGARPPTRGLNNYAILAFATHGLVTGNLGNTLAEPALALAPPSMPGPSDDGLLTGSEAALLRLDADWVLLSACNSAAGGSTNAQGLTGLARAFLLAGARAVLVSHWRVRDDAAPRITGRTIQLMQGGLSRGKALQQSMRELMLDPSFDATGSSFATPSAWAAFTLVGVD